MGESRRNEDSVNQLIENVENEINMSASPEWSPEMLAKEDNLLKLSS